MSLYPLTVDLSTSGNHTIVSGIDRKIILIQRVQLSSETEVSVQFFSGVNQLTGPMVMLSMVLDEQPGTPWYICGRGESFIISLGSSVQTGGAIWYDIAP